MSHSIFRNVLRQGFLGRFVTPQITAPIQPLFLGGNLGNLCGQKVMISARVFAGSNFTEKQSFLRHLCG